MPIIPFLGEDENTIDDVIRAVKDHGAKFVIGAGMSIAGTQAERTFEAVKELNPKIEANGEKCIIGTRMPNVFRVQPIPTPVP